MRVPGNQPRDLLSCALAVFGVGGLIFVAQVAFLGGSPLPLAALAVASAAMLVAGARGIARMNRETAARVDEHSTVREEVARTMGPVVARWTYDPDEWEAWTAREDAHRSRGAWAIPVVAALIGGGAGLRRGVDAAIGAAALMAVFAAAMLAWSGRAAAGRQRDHRMRGGTVTIATHAVLVDGGRDFWVDPSTRVARVQYLAEAQPVLAITVRYGGRAAYEHTVRIPVPRGRDGEARELADRFAEGRWHTAPVAAASR
jgi:hypothetical protein